VTHRWYYGFGAYAPDKYLEDIRSPEELTFEKVAKDRLIAGSPAQCLEQLKMWQEEIKPDYLMLRMRQLGDPPQAEALRDIRLFGEQVIPKL
jgi:alkanesulfonate monooxygenase SsuD/methylene tetrahydromethanopterin reductase-like flavin-dependent oxidoreductase (luciferase family)